MQYDEFIEKVKLRGRMRSLDEAVQVTHTTLEVLGQLLTGEENDMLAARLPQEIGRHLKKADGHEKFDLIEFFRRIAKREGAGFPSAVYHARAVVSAVSESVGPDVIQQINAQLPNEFRSLFPMEDLKPVEKVG